MGVRYLTMVYQNDKCKVAQYGNNNGFPADAGSKVLSFLRNLIENESLLKEFDTHVEHSLFVNNETINKAAEDFCSGNLNDKLSVVDFFRQYPQFDIGTGWEVLNLLCKGALALKDDSHRVNDGVFTEFAYVIDLDNRTFEVYSGFNRNKLTKSDRFYCNNQDDILAEFGAYPLKLLAVFSFEGLPNEQEFVDEIYDIMENWNQ